MARAYIEPDYLWRNVWASVQPYVPGWSGDEFDDETYTEFLVEVTNRGTVVYDRVIVSDLALDRGAEVYSVILGDMVRKIDGRLDVVYDRG